MFWEGRSRYFPLYTFWNVQPSLDSVSLHYNDIEIRSTINTVKYRGVVVCGSYLLVVTPLSGEANNRCLVYTREVEGSARFLVDNNVGAS